MLFTLALHFSFHVKADEVKAMHDIPTVANVRTNTATLYFTI